MFTVILRKARADLWERRFHNSLIFLVITAATTTVTLTLSVYLSATQGFTNMFEAAHSAHVWFTSNQAAALEPLRSLGGVVESNDPFPALWDGITLKSDNNNDSLALWGLSSEPVRVGKPVLVEGRWLASGAKNEIVIDAGLARARGVMPGDQIEIDNSHGSHFLKIVGLALNTGRPAFPTSKPALGYVLPETLTDLESDQTQWAWMLGVRIISPDSAEQFINSARAAYPPQANISATPWQWVRDEVNDSIALNLLFLGVFGVFALVAVGLVIINLVGGYVAGQAREVGLLKTIGFTPRQVTMLFMFEYVTMGMIAAFIGACAALMLTPLFLNEVLKVLGTVPVLTNAPAWVLLILLVMLILLSLLTYLPTRHSGRLAIVNVLNARTNTRAVQASSLAGFALRFGLSPGAALGLKDIFTQPLRTTLTLVSLLVAIVTVIFTLSVDSTLQSARSDPTIIGGLPYILEAQRTDITTQTERISNADTMELLKQFPEISAYLTLKNIPLAPESRSTQGIEQPGFVSYAIGGDYQAFRWHLLDGRMFSTPGEAVITNELADQLGVHIGDQITLRVMQPGDGFFTDSGKRLTVRIVGRYLAIHDGGRRMIYSLDTYRQQVDAAAEPDRYGLKLESGISADSFRVQLQNFSGDRLQVTAQNLPDSVGLIRITLLGLTATLLMIAAVNLLTTLLFAVRERHHDFGILKTIGFTPAQLVISVIANGTVLGLSAIVLGSPLGLGTTRILFDVIGEQLHLGRGIFALPSPLLLAMLAPITLGLIILGSVIPARQASDVKVVDALQYE